MDEKNIPAEAQEIAYQDRCWYWIEKESWGTGQTFIAPALYKAECDAWYSAEFSGISTRFLKVLEPIRRTPPPAQAYRMLVPDVDVIQPDDEYLSDDTTTWEPAGHCIFVGMHHLRAMKPGRRAIKGSGE